MCIALVNAASSACHLLTSAIHALLKRIVRLAEIIYNLVIVDMRASLLVTRNKMLMAYEHKE